MLIVCVFLRTIVEILSAINTLTNGGAARAVFPKFLSDVWIKTGYRIESQCGFFP
jgi:hypothetical protein